MRHRKTGFTVIELLLVIAIIGLLAAVALTNLKGSGEKARLASAKNLHSSISHVLGSDAVGIWRFETLGDSLSGGLQYDRETLDDSGHGNHAYSRAGVLSTGIFGPAFQSPGPSVSCCDLVVKDESPFAIKGSITVAAWVFPFDTTCTYQGIVSKWGLDTGNKNSYTLYLARDRAVMRVAGPTTQAVP